MLRVWRRLLADEDAVRALREDGYLEGLHRALETPAVVSTDANASYIARVLMECSDFNSSVPFGLPSARYQSTPARVAGKVTSVRANADGCTLRISGTPDPTLVRFNTQAFLRTIPRGLTGHEVLVLGIGDPKEIQSMVGIALVLRSAT